MSEIVFTDKVEVPVTFDEYSNRRLPSDRKITLFQSHNKVALVDSVLVVGMPVRGSTKRYYQWRTIGSLGFRTNSNGTVIPYEASRPWDFKVSTKWNHRIPVTPFAMLEGTTGKYFSRVSMDATGAFQQAVWSTFGIRTMQDLYPIANEYGLISYRTIPYGLRRAMRNDDWTDFSTMSFGKKRTTPRLVAAVKQTEPYIVALAQQFRGYVSDEDLVSFMENNHFDDEMEAGFEPHSPNLRPVLALMTANTPKNILRAGLDLSDTRRYAVLGSLVKRMQISNGWQRDLSLDKEYKSLSELIYWVK